MASIFDTVLNDLMHGLIERHFTFYRRLNDDEHLARMLTDWLFERCRERAGDGRQTGARRSMSQSGMPTFFAEPRFWYEYEKLSREDQALFKGARNEFIRLLREWENAKRPGVPQFPKSLGIKPMGQRRRIMEFAWAPDGRCAWQYGTPQRPGKFHIIWRHIGSHAIYNDP